MKQMKNRWMALAVVCVFLFITPVIGMASATEEAAYAPVLEMYAGALNGNLAPDALMETGVNILCLYAGPEGEQGTAEDIGFAFADLDGNGVQELIIGGLNETEWPGRDVVYAIYTLKDGQPQLLCESWERNLVRVLEDNTIYSSGSSGAGLSEYVIESIGPDGLTLQFVEAVVYDAERDSQIIWYHAEGETLETAELTPLMEEDALALMESLHAVTFDLKPFAQYAVANG